MVLPAQSCCCCLRAGPSRRWSTRAGDPRCRRDGFRNNLSSSHWQPKAGPGQMAGATTRSGQGLLLLAGDEDALARLFRFLAEAGRAAGSLGDATVGARRLFVTAYLSAHSQSTMWSGIAASLEIEDKTVTYLPCATLVTLPSGPAGGVVSAKCPLLTRMRIKPWYSSTRIRTAGAPWDLAAIDLRYMEVS